MATTLEQEGIRKFKNGALMLMLSSIFIIAGFVLILVAGISAVLSGFSSFGSLTGSPPSSSITSSVLEIGSELLIGFVLILIAPILNIIGVIFARGGFGILKNIGRDVGIGKTGGTLYLIGLVLVLLGYIGIFVEILSLGASAVNLNSNSALAALGGIFLAGLVVLLGGLLSFIGDIMFSIGIHKLGDVYNEGSVKVGGILLLIAFILVIGTLVYPYVGLVGFILYFIGSILTYVGARRINPLGAIPFAQPFVPQYQQPYFPPYQPPTYQQFPQTFPPMNSQPPTYQPYPPNQPPLYQSPPTQSVNPPPTYQQPPAIPQQPNYPAQSQGEIRRDGYAKLKIYSQSNAIIVSANIQNPNIMATYINPIMLTSGYNDLVLYFGNVSSLTPGQTYPILITMNVNGQMTTMTAYATYRG